VSARRAPMLLVSPDGMLGRAFDELLRARGADYDAARWPEFDLTKPESCEPWMHDGLRIVLNCAAYTDVDGAEAHEDDAYAVNAAGAALLAGECLRTGALLVHFSTDYVFDGNATSPYATDHPLSPASAYGRSKAIGEEAIRGSGCEHLIVRTSWLYAPWAKNFVTTMLALGRERDEIRVVDDQHGRPTSARSLAERTLTLVERGARGTFHVTDSGECSWYELATEIHARSGSGCRVEPCTSAEFVRAAKRPAYSVLDTTKTDALLGPAPDWRENLQAVLDEIAEIRARH
jgi:dTDP-4-dehydrorhamnose reductase